MWIRKKIQLKNCDIIAFTPRTFPQRVIAYFSGKFCHIGFVIKGEKLKQVLDRLFKEEANRISINDWYVVSSSVAYRGIGWERLKDIAGRYKGFWIFTIKDLSYLEKMSIYSYFLGSVGKEYSLWQIIRIFFCILFNITKKVSGKQEMGTLICSEYVGSILSLLDDYKGKSLAYATPDDIVNGFERLELVGVSEK